MEKKTYLSLQESIKSVIKLSNELIYLILILKAHLPTFKIIGNLIEITSKKFKNSANTIMDCYVIGKKEVKAVNKK